MYNRKENVTEIEQELGFCLCVPKKWSMAIKPVLRQEKSKQCLFGFEKNSAS